METTNYSLNEKSVEDFLSLYFQESSLNELSQRSQLSNEDLERYFLPKSVSQKQAYARRAFHIFSQVVPSEIRKSVLKPIKKIRKSNAKPEKMPKDCFINQALQELEKKGAKRKLFRGKRAAICLSYDVDQAYGHEYLPHIQKELESYNFKASFQILTDWEYQPDWNVINTLKTAGHEVGLHGSSHDISLGYKSTKHIQDELHRAISKTPFTYKGYRAPALCMSPRLMSEVIKMGFKYDSSLPTSNMYYKSNESSFPYFFEVHGHHSTKRFWQLPVGLQDSTLFLDHKMTDQEALLRTQEYIEDILEIGGVFVLNLHPYVVRDHQNYQSQLFEFIKEKTNLAVMTQEQVIDVLETGSKGAENSVESMETIL